MISLKKVGFIGIGIMGEPMCRNTMKAGFEAVVYNHHDNERVQRLVSEGAVQAYSPKEVAGLCDVVVTMLPDSPQVEEVALGANGIAEGGREGLVVIDMSSISPVATKRIAVKLKEKGIDMLDAPVSGGEPGAVAGTLAIMVGGDQDVFDSCHDILKAMGSTVTLVGSVGAGHTTKLANNMIVALNIAAVSEAIAFCVKSGVDPEKVHQAIRVGSAGSSVLDAKLPKMVSGDFTPGFKMSLHIKDLKNALDAGHDIGSPMPFTAEIMEIMQSLKADGHDNTDHSAIVKYFEYMSKVSVTKSR